MNRVQRTLLTAVVMVGVGGGLAAYAWQQKKAEPERIRQQREAARLFRFGLDHTKGGFLEAKGYRMRFRRAESGGWEITEPIVWPGETEAIITAIEQMSALIYDTITVEGATEEQLADYGLDQPKVVLHVDLESGESAELRVGAKNELRDGYYATTGDAQTVYIVPSSFYWSVDRELFAFRSKTLMTIPRKEIQEVTVTKGDEPVFRVERAKGDEWLLSETEGRTNLIADPVVMNKLLVLLTRDLRAETILTDAFEADQPKERSAYGLNPASLTLRVLGENGQKAIIDFGYAPQNPDEAATAEGSEGEHDDHDHEDELREVYAHLRGTGTLAEVYPTVIEDLDTDVERIRDRRLSQFDPDVIQEIHMLLFDGSFTKMKRQDTKWVMSEPVQGLEAKPWKVEEILKRFSKLRSDEVYKDGPTVAELREWLLDPPQRKIVFFDGKGAVIDEVRIGTGLDAKRTFIKNAKGSRVDLIKNPRLAVLPTSVKELQHDGD